MSGGAEFIQNFSALAKRQLVRAAVLAFLGYSVFALLGHWLGMAVEPVDVLPLYGLFVLDEMGYRIRQDPYIYVICAAALSLLAAFIAAVILYSSAL